MVSMGSSDEYSHGPVGCQQSQMGGEDYSYLKCAGDEYSRGPMRSTVCDNNLGIQLGE